MYDLKRCTLLISYDTPKIEFISNNLTNQQRSLIMGSSPRKLLAASVSRIWYLASLVNGKLKTDISDSHTD